MSTIQAKLSKVFKTVSLALQNNGKCGILTCDMTHKDFTTQSADETLDVSAPENGTDGDVDGIVADNGIADNSAPVADPAPQSFAPFTGSDRTKPESSRRVWSNIFFVVVIVLSLYFMYDLSSQIADGTSKSFAEVMSHANVGYLVLSVAVLLVMMALDSLKYYVILKTVVPDKTTYGLALKVSLVGKYYDNITPFSSGGQPFQIYHLHKKGLSGGESSAVIMIKYAFNVIFWLSICFCLMLFDKNVLFQYIETQDRIAWFQVAGWVGFGINLSLPLLILCFAFMPKVTGRVVAFFLKIAAKLHIIKSDEDALAHAKRIAYEFRNGFVIMSKKPLRALLLVFLCIAEPFLSMTLPYFVVLALGGGSIVPGIEMMFAIMTLNVYSSMSVMFVPTPGNSLAVESLFLYALEKVVAPSALFWTVLGWRFLSYYSFIVIGLVMTIVSLVRKNIKK